MKLSKVSKKINVLKGEIGDLQNRINRAMRVLEGNEFPEDLKALQVALGQKKDRLIALKNARMKANVEHGMYEVILALGEAKSTLHWLDEIDVSSGKSRGSMYDDAKTVSYKSQMTVAEKQGILDGLRADIEDMVDKLDDFNAGTTIEV